MNNKLRVQALRIGLGCLAACAPPMQGEAPPENRVFYYPSHLAVAPDQSQVYVVSANFDQRYHAGWISTLSTDCLLHQGQGCQPRIHTLKVPSLGGRLSLHSDGTLGLLSHRGMGLVTVLQKGSDQVLHCGAPDRKGGLKPFEKKTDCDREHLIRLAQRVDALQSRQVRDPYATAFVTLPQGQQAAAVGYVSSSWVMFFGIQNHTLQDAADVTFYPGATLGLVPHPLPAYAGYLLAPARQSDAGTHPSVIYALDASHALRAQEALPWQRTRVSTDAGGLEVADLLFSPDGAYVYATNRSPDSVLAFQWVPPLGSPGSGSLPELRLLSAVALEGSPLTSLAYIPRPQGDLLVAASLLDDMLYFFAPQYGQLQLVHRIHLDSRGPFALAQVRVGGHHFLLVTLFFDHGLTLIDVSSESFYDFKPWFQVIS